ncbi:MAG: hypothetical protein ACKO3R_10450 [bacterium]
MIEQQCHAVVDAFIALDYKNLEPLVMYPNHEGNQGSTKNLLRYPEEILCYPYDSPSNTSKYLKKNPKNMQTQVADPFDLAIMKEITYDNVAGFLDRHKPPEFNG